MLPPEIPIVFERDDFVVIQKPSGLVVNKSTTVSGPTLQEYISEAHPQIATSDSEFIARNGIVHRLDKDTSGLLVVAKTEEAFNLLKNAFKDRLVHKEYRAIVHEYINDSLFEVDLPIKRNNVVRTRFGVSASGRPAFTRFEVITNFIKNSARFSLIKAFPLTGRTHQIRVHLAAIKHPVAGDCVYAGKKLQALGLDTFQRMMLHAHILSLSYKGENFTFESQLPSDFANPTNAM